MNMPIYMVRAGGVSVCRRLAWGLVALLGVLAGLAWVSPALAHASLLGSVPAAGSALSTAPDEFRLRFNEPVSPLVLRIIHPDGRVVDLQQVETLPDGLLVMLPELVEHGTYALSWRVVSADGHPVGGAVAFSVGAGPAPDPGPAPAASAGDARTALVWLARATWYASLFIGIGLAGFHALGGGLRDRRRLGMGMLLLGALATVLNVGLLGVDALDAPVSGLLGIDAWRTAGGTSFGLSAAWALAATGCAALVWYVAPARAGGLLAGLAIMLLATALASSGHASTADPAWLARPAVWLHGVAVTLWIGSLLPLSHALGDARGPAWLARFSRCIPVVLLALVASGGVLVFLQLDAIASLWRTDYGLVLVAKLGLLAGLLGLAAYNRYRLTSAVLRSEAAPARTMRTIIRLELALALLILMVVALWRFTPPPRALEAGPVPAGIVSAHAHGDAAVADLKLTPASGGRPARLALVLSQPDATPLEAQEVDVVFSSELPGIEPMVFSATRSSDASTGAMWRIDPLALPYQDAWRVRIDVLVSDFERISLETRLEPSNKKP